MASFRYIFLLAMVVLTIFSMLSMVAAAPIREDELEVSTDGLENRSANVLEERGYGGHRWGSRGYRGRHRGWRHKKKGKPTRSKTTSKPRETPKPTKTTTRHTPAPTTKTTTKHTPRPTTKTTTKHTPTPTSKTTTTTQRPRTTTTTTRPKPTPTSGGGSGGGSGTYRGEATYYTPGLGSCGRTNSESDLIVALNYVQMANGANPNNNPKCGDKIRVYGPKGSVTVTIVDTCPSCKYGDVDLSPAAFQKIADLPQGRVGASWSFL